MDTMERLRACLRFDEPTPVESEIEAAAREAIGEIARLRAQAQHETDCAEAYRVEADHLRDENAKLWEALSFYADATRYRGPNISLTEPDRWSESAGLQAYRLDVTRDGGDIATQALAAMRKGE